MLEYFLNHASQPASLVTIVRTALEAGAAGFRCAGQSLRTHVAEILPAGKASSVLSGNWTR